MTTSVHLLFEDRTLHGSIRLSLTRQQLMQLERAIAQRGSESLYSTLAPYVPSVTAGAHHFNFQNASFELEKKTFERAAMTVTLSRVRMDPETPSLRVRIWPGWWIAEPAITTFVHTTAAEVLAISTAPRQQSYERTEFDSGREPLVFDIVPVGRPDPASTRVGEMVQRFDSTYLYMIDPLVTGVMYSIPFLLLIALRRRLSNDELPASGGFVSSSIAMVLFFTGAGILRASVDLYSDPTRWLGERLVDNCRWYFLDASGAATIGAVFIACYWPVFATGTRQRIGDASSRTRIRLWLLALLSSVLTVLLAFETCVGDTTQLHPGTIGDTSRQAFDALRAALGNVPEVWGFLAAIATAVFALAAASAEVTRGPGALAAGVVTTFFAGMLEFLDTVVNPSNTVALVLVSLLVTPLVYALIHLIAPNHARWGLALFVAALLVVRPMPGYDLWWEAAVNSVASDLAPALRLLAAWFLIRVLRDLSNTGQWDVLEEGERDAGTILALMFLFMPSHQWLYITVSILLGWLVLRYWIFVPRTIPSESNSDIPATIRDVIRLNEAEVALRAMKKEMRGKLAKGEVPFHDYERHVRGMEAFVDELRARMQPGNDNAPAAVLSSGQPAPPWTRAMIGAKYGLLFALPWIVLYLYNFHGRYAPDRGSEWIGSIGTAVQVMGQWPLLGLFFGYFYPHLRGETGLAKGLYLFMAVVSPSLAATALAMATSNAAWMSFSFWALQLFIHCMLLGLLAGDYETLRKAGLGWRHVVDVHNLGALAAWGSSLLLAIGAAITTYVTAQGGALLMQALQKVPDLTK
jgi:hypothetical protein